MRYPLPELEDGEQWFLVVRPTRTAARDARSAGPFVWSLRKLHRPAPHHSNIVLSHALDARKTGDADDGAIFMTRCPAGNTGRVRSTLRHPPHNSLSRPGEGSFPGASQPASWTTPSKGADDELDTTADHPPAIQSSST